MGSVARLATVDSGPDFEAEKPVQSAQVWERAADQTLLPEQKKVSDLGFDRRRKDRSFQVRLKKYEEKGRKAEAKRHDRLAEVLEAVIKKMPADVRNKFRDLAVLAAGDFDDQSFGALLVHIEQIRNLR